MDNNELHHHGIKGMKWGVRRTPAQLGHKTSGKKKKSGLSLFKKKEKEAAKPKPKSSKDMTNDELQSAIRNMQLQQQYNQLKNQLEPHKEKGKGFVGRFMDESVKPAAIQAGKSVLTDYLTKMGKKYLGIDAGEAGDALGALRKEVEGLKLTNDKGKYEDAIKAREKKRAKEAAEEAKKEDDDDSSSSTKTSKFKKSEESKTYKKKVYTGEVVGEGTSKRSESSSTKRQRDDIDLGDADWKDLGTYSSTSSGRSYVSKLSSGSVARLPAAYESSGRSYVAGLLEERK